MGQAIARIGHNARLEAALGKTIDVPANLPNNVIQNHNQWMKDAGQAGSGTVKMKRRDAWARVLRASIDVHRFEGRRAYTNQSMLVDFNIYYANRGLMIVDRERALTEKQALRYVYEAIGLLPWLGNDTEEGGSEMPYGAHYYQITRKGLSRELGWVGTYGETILRFSRDVAEFSGDEKVKQQLTKIQSARIIFRYPSVDPEGGRIMS